MIIIYSYDVIAISYKLYMYNFIVITLYISYKL